MDKRLARMKRQDVSRHRLKPAYAAVLLAVAMQTAQANPTGGSVASGSASFATSGNTLTVTNTPGTIINWQDFSIGSNEITSFAQQSASSTVLNRVVGNDPSNILGTLQSNGRVFLVNPNGILFGAGAVVDVAGLVASTLNLSDADFIAGNNHFTEVTGAAGISNAGNINAQGDGQQGGEIYLIAPDVENTGVITAPNGDILLAAGASVDLVNTNDPNLRVNITAPAGDVTNVGQLIASSGSLGLFGTVVSNAGVVSADSATMEGGKIVFKASQLAEVGGTVSATGTTGGDINLLGNQVAVLGNVDASGIEGGGTVLVGGDAHGANPDVPNAQYTYVDGNAMINADAIENGDGGKVVVWADTATQFNGNISARGGAQSGDGGWVETSGKQSLGFAGLVDTTAAHGSTGSLLLDPTAITISAGPIGGSTTTLSLGALIAESTTATTANLTVGDLQNLLSSTSVTVTTSSASLLGTDSITVQNAITWSSANSLTLNAGGTGMGSITINSGANISNTYSGSGGNLSLVTDGGAITIGGGISLVGGTFDVNAYGGAAITMTGAVNVNKFTLSDGTWKQIAATLPGFTASTGFDISGGTFIRALGGNGTTANPYQLADIYGVQGIGSSGMLGNAYVLANNVDASVTQNWLDVNGLPVGFVPIGVSGSGFTGQFNGQGHTISNLTINQGTASDVGLFGYSSGTISNVGLISPKITGGSAVGGLVGYDYASFSSSSSGGVYTGGNISNSYVSNGIISGGSDVGGLVGYDYAGNISNSYSSGGSVSATGNNVGGLVGYFSNNFSTNASISASYVKGGSVTGASYVGGLVGSNSESTITGSHVDSVTVSGSGTGTGIGGLVGYNNSTFDSGGAGIGIVNSYVNNGIVNGYSEVGGLVGYNRGANLSNDYVSGGTVSGTYNVGGLVGYDTGNFASGSSVSSWTGSISNSYVNNGTIVTGTSSDVGGMVGYLGSSSTISNSYVSGGKVTGTVDVGGLVGYSDGNLNGDHVTGLTVVSTANDTAADVGGLIGYNTGTISNSYASNGTVITTGGSSSTGVQDVGGLVGYNSGVIIGSYVSNGSVSGAGTASYYFGGLVGYNVGGSASGSGSYPGGTIINSYVNNGIVNGYSDVGGLAGYNSGQISNSYASGGTVSGNVAGYNVGGLVGKNDSAGTIKTSYASNAVSGGNYVGGFAGYNIAFSGAVSDNFWNTTTAGVGVIYGIGYDAYGGTPGAPSNDPGTAYGMNAANMMTLANFTSATVANGNINPGWDISGTLGAGTTWFMIDGMTMPLLYEFIMPISGVVDTIVDTTDQKKDKPKDQELLVDKDAPGTTPGLPMCN